MITLRFSKGWAPNPSPIVLRFIQVPQLDLPWGQIGAVVSIDNLSTALQQDILIDNTSIATESQTGIGWLGYRAGTEFDIRYSVGPLVTAEYSLNNVIGIMVSAITDIAWAWRYRTAFEIATAWDQQQRPVHMAFDLPWFTPDNRPQIDTMANWIFGSPRGTEWLHWWYSDNNQVDREYLINWEPSKKRWICTTNHVPAKGSMTLRFSRNEQPQAPVMVLRFTPSGQTCYYDDGGGLIDSNPDLPNFDFKIPIEPQIRRAYIMQPVLKVHRVSDNTEIAVTSVTISNSRGQMCSDLQIDYGSRADCLLAQNELLRININGYEFYGVPEQPTRRQSFNQQQYSASGRGASALLAAPWKLPVNYSNNTDRSLAGIITDLLFGTSWTVQIVGFTDFNIPAKVFSTTGKAPLDAISDMVASIGCMLVEDDEAQILKVLPRWPVTPWNMGTEIADIAIHEAVIESYNATTEINQLCDSAWVRGEQVGVSRHVRRQGTAGNRPTSDITNALIVSDTPARLAGTDAIARTGLKERVTVTLPVMNDLPPLVKGMLIGVSYFGEIYKATCDSTTISASIGQDGSIDVSQSANLIRHLE